MHVDIFPEDWIKVTEAFTKFLRKQHLGHLVDQYEEQLEARAEDRKHRIRFVGGGEV
jgi:hypothetical protein